MEQVGDVVGKLLRDAEATATQLREEAEAESHQLTIQSRAEAERVRREADQQGPPHPARGAGERRRGRRRGPP